AVVRRITVQVGPAEIFSVFQGIEAAMNIVVLLGAALFFLTLALANFKHAHDARGMRNIGSFSTIS
ncbi:MAG: hypothetical protein WBY01_16525, partial [Pseudolabrys sp.]